MHGILWTKKVETLQRVSKIFARVLNVLFFLLGNSPVSGFYVPTFRNSPCSIFLGGVSRKKIKVEESIPKRLHIQFRSRSIMQKIQQKINQPAGTISSRLFILLTLPMKMEQSVPKRRRIKFRRRGTTQKKEYNISKYLVSTFFLLNE
jgi:hypothetical protein